MRAIKTYQTYDDSIVRVGEELRKSVRFRVFNSFLRIEDKTVEVFDASFGGLSLKTVDYPTGTKLKGLWIIEGKTLEVSLEVKRVGKEFSGTSFLVELPEIQSLLDPATFSRETFKMVLSKESRDRLIYKNSSGNICLGFQYGADKKIVSFFFSFQNVFLSWKENSGTSSGIILFENSFDQAWGEDSKKQKDFIIDKNKIQLFSHIIENNPVINLSLKDWIRDNFEILHL